MTASSGSRSQKGDVQIRRGAARGIGRFVLARYVDAVGADARNEWERRGSADKAAEQARPTAAFAHGSESRFRID